MAKIKNHIPVDDTVREKATVGDYHGALRLRLRNAYDILYVTSSPSSVEPKNDNQPSQSAVTPASKMDIGRITYEWTNRTVTVSGTITVAGTVKLYQGQHEIILGNPEAVKIPSN